MGYVKFASFQLDFKSHFSSSVHKHYHGHYHLVPQSNAKRFSDTEYGFHDLPFNSPVFKADTFLEES